MTKAAWLLHDGLALGRDEIEPLVEQVASGTVLGWHWHIGDWVLGWHGAEQLQWIQADDIEQVG